MKLRNGMKWKQKNNYENQWKQTRFFENVGKILNRTHFMRPALSKY